MVDERVIVVSMEGCKKVANSQNGRGVHWTTDINDELPIKMTKSGEGSEAPFTMCKLFQNAVEVSGSRPAMLVERGGKYIQWTWNEYYKDSVKFAKALASLNITSRSGVCILGFNAPEWAIAFMGSPADGLFGPRHR